jgi:hypothetical protein
VGVEHGRETVSFSDAVFKGMIGGIQTGATRAWRLYDTLYD